MVVNEVIELQSVRPVPAKCIEPLHSMGDFKIIYIGPLFESVGHGYETTDYKKLDSRLGTNEDLTEFVGKSSQM